MGLTFAGGMVLLGQPSACGTGRKSMITSTSNVRVKQIVQWQTKARERREAGIFLAEGIKMFLEAPTDWIREVYVSEELEGRLRASPGQRQDLHWNPMEKEAILQEERPESKASSQNLSEKEKVLQESRSDCQDSHWNLTEKEAVLQEKLQETGYETVSEEVFRKMSDTLAPQGILAVLKRPEYSLQTLLKTPDPFFIVLENLQDPGNLGTILRTGEGAGVTGVILSSDTADIFNPKTIRATMGSIYRVPFCRTSDMKETLEQLREAGVVTYAAHLRGKDYYDGVSFKGPVAFLIGNEGNGLKEETAALAERYVKIPMEGKVESLNAAVAAALLMYEVRRQRAAGRKSI